MSGQAAKFTVNVRQQLRQSARVSLSEIQKQLGDDMLSIQVSGISHMKSVADF
jgi:hypothetical protein